MTEVNQTGGVAQDGEKANAKTVKGKVEDRVRAVQIVNRMVIDREELGRECSREDYDAERALFREGCAKLANILDADVQVVLGKLLRDRHHHNVLHCTAWRRLLAEVEKSAH